METDMLYEDLLARMAPQVEPTPEEECAAAVVAMLSSPSKSTRRTGAIIHQGMVDDCGPAEAERLVGAALDAFMELLADESRDRCPRCGSTDLQWGQTYGNCRNCGYTGDEHQFEPKEVAAT